MFKRGLDFRIGAIIWGLKFWDPKYACLGSEIWGREDYLESDNISMSPKASVSDWKFWVAVKSSWLFTVCFGCLKTLVWLFWGLRKLLDMSTLVPKVKEFSPGKKLCQFDNTRDMIILCVKKPLVSNQYKYWCFIDCMMISRAEMWTTDQELLRNCSMLFIVDSSLNSSSWIPRWRWGSKATNNDEMQLVLI